MHVLHVLPIIVESGIVQDLIQNAIPTYENNVNSNVIDHINQCIFGDPNSKNYKYSFKKLNPIFPPKCEYYKFDLKI
jgi:hypothetical protein